MGEKIHLPKVDKEGGEIRGRLESLGIQIKEDGLYSFVAELPEGWRIDPTGIETRDILDAQSTIQFTDFTHAVDDYLVFHQHAAE